MSDSPVRVELHATHRPEEFARLAEMAKRRTRSRRALEFLVALLAGIILGALCAVAANAAPRPGTWTWNYKNRPVVATLDGYECVAVSPRGILAAGVADSLKLIGASTLVWLQPAVATTNGVPVSGPDYPWDTAALEVIARYGAILKTPAGAPVVLWPGTYGSTVIDYRDTAFVDAYGALIAATFKGKAAGVLFDYGCGDIGWNTALGIDATTWAAWRVGYIRLCARLRAAGLLVVTQCDQYPDDLKPVTDGARYEQAGMSLNPLAKVWANTATHPAWTLVGVEELVPLKRRAFAALSLIRGARFNWSDLRGDYGGGTKLSYPDYEHFVMNVGPTAGAIRMREAGVYSRNFTRGFAVLNMTTHPHAYYLTSTVKIVVQPGDGLVVQTRDALGRYITRITNEGR